MATSTKTKKKKFDPLHSRIEFRQVFLSQDTVVCDAEYDQEMHGRKGTCNSLLNIDELELNKNARKKHQGSLARSTIVFHVRCDNTSCPHPEGFIRKEEFKMYDSSRMRLIPK